MATPSSTSAYHRRRSFRNGSLKENPPFSAANSKAPTPPLPSPSVLRARNGIPPTPVRELFTTPRPSPSLNGGLRAARAARAARTPVPLPSKAVAPRRPINLQALRTVNAAVTGAGVGGITALVVTLFARCVLRIGTAGGVFAALLRLLGLCGITIAAFMIIVLSHNISTAVPVQVDRVLGLNALRFFLGSRAHILHAVLSVAVAVVHTLFLAAVIGAFDPLPGFTDGRQLASYTTIAAFSGLAFSYLAQTGGNLVWRFSPTRESPFLRARASLPNALYLSVAGVVSGTIMSNIALEMLYQAALTAHIISYASSYSSAGLSSKVAAVCATFLTLFCWSLALTVFQILMTTPIAVRRYIANVPAGAVKVEAQNNRDFVDTLLTELSPRGGSPVLNQLLALQFFRDIALSSRPGRSAVFADPSGNAWSVLFIGCMAPIDTLTDALAKVAPTRLHSVMSASGGRARMAAPKAPAPYFGEGRAVVWACETISHFLVASREEDDYGVAQRTFVHVIISLLNCKEHVDAARQRGGVGVAPVVVDHGGEGANTGIVERVLNYQNPHNAIFAPEVVGSAVSDALNLALFRLVDAFRVHLQGYLIGAEPHWDRRLDRALKACLDMDGM